MAKQNGTGQGGKTLNDRKLAASVRTQALNDVLAVLQGKPEVEEWSDYKKQLLAKMSSSLLPRLNEHTGEDGEPLNLLYDKSFIAPTPAGDKPQG